MKHLFLPLFTAAIFLLCSCASEYIPYEILQTSKYEKVYTAYTLWYTDPADMTSENIQQGKILPFGTEVRITKVNENGVWFDAAGKKFQILIADKNMENIHHFVKRTFSVKNAQELAGEVSAADFEKMKRGVVSEGMTEQQVLTAMGRPSLARTRLLSSDTWIYQAGPVKSIRVIFKKEKKENTPRKVYRVFEL